MAAYEAAGLSDDWHTPPYIFAALGEEFDLDVSAPITGPRHVPARAWHSKANDGLMAPWLGFIQTNPPFGHMKNKRAWLQRFFAHANGIALVPDRTSAPWFQEAAPLADAILFVAPKIKFEQEDGSIGKSPGTGTALMAVGSRATRALIRSRLGVVMYSGAAS